MIEFESSSKRKVFTTAQYLTFLDSLQLIRVYYIHTYIHTIFDTNHLLRRNKNKHTKCKPRCFSTTFSSFQKLFVPLMKICGLFTEIIFSLLENIQILESSLNYTRKS